MGNQEEDDPIETVDSEEEEEEPDTPTPAQHLKAVKRLLATALQARADPLTVSMLRDRLKEAEQHHKECRPLPAKIQSHRDRVSHLEGKTDKLEYQLLEARRQLRDLEHRGRPQTRHSRAGDLRSLVGHVLRRRRRVL